MKYTRGMLPLALAGVLGVPALARAEVVIRTPVGTFVVGRPPARPMPLVNVQVGRIFGVQVTPGVAPGCAPSLAPAPTPVGPPVPAPRELPPSVDLPPAALPAVPVVLTLKDFATTFQPTPGFHEVRIVHPYTREAVTVAFTLPEGAPRKVHVNHREIEFDYGKHSVDIRFQRKGSVNVSAD